ncbi:dihydrodipicolinate synthase family protein [Blastopirellula marina]|uniref:Probable N-acetylneuraminate lyase n=1 Tax=Blastopirellula marina DSM 3645 TaxID=314230 RepID=A3ZVC7_9BACT|nr:dihydrodipicolinate synthase family protein [Blastopirellula marina]EAQ79273.1 probable N-acetylneuraminate lyase [Blastopirellula marina DSM 3645]
MKRLTGLIAATYTPFGADGRLRLDQTPQMVEHLVNTGVNGLYVCGSTGEGMSLTSEERRLVAESYVKAADGRLPVIVQVGHNSVAEAKQLAAHAQAIGADAVSATCPSYFKVQSPQLLVDCMREIACGAPKLPFYYYHVPLLTGSLIDIQQFIQLGGEQIPNLFGLKYTDTKLNELQQCLKLQNQRFDVVWGCDDMILGAWASGATGAIGSTYNIAAPLYHQLITAVEAGDWNDARALQNQAIEMINVIGTFPFHSAMKAILGMLGYDFGTCRLPQRALSSNETAHLRELLEQVGFFEGFVTR